MKKDSFNIDSFDLLENLHDKDIHSEIVIYITHDSEELLDQVNIELSKIQLLTILRILGTVNLKKISPKLADFDCFTDEDLVKVNNMILNEFPIFDIDKKIKIKNIKSELEFAEFMEEKENEKNK